MIMGCAGNYWDARGNVGMDLCSPLDALCISQGAAATRGFNQGWNRCAAPTNYKVLAPKTQDPNLPPVAQHLAAVPTAAPVRPLSPHPAITTGSYFWLVGPRQFPFQPMVVNPSPGSQSTAGSTAQTAPGSAVSQANGMPANGMDGGLAPTVQGYVTGGYVPAVAQQPPKLSDFALLVGGGLLAAAFL